MAQNTAQKLRIREGMNLRTVDAPNDFKSGLGDLPEGAAISPSSKKFDQIHWFVRSQDALKENLPRILEMLSGGVVCWVYYPKISSGMKTDLTRDKGWDVLMQEDLQWLSMISFNDTWTAFGMRRKTDADQKKAGAPRERPGSDLIDPKTKTVLLPDDVKKLFSRHKGEAEYFNSLAFSHRREYIEWIVGAKRQETRDQRLEKMIAMLGSQKKNPSDR